MLWEPESTKYQDLGHAVHQALLEPQLFDELYVVAPKVDKRFKAGKAAWAEFEKQAAGRTIVTKPEMVMMRGLLSSIAGHVTAREALYGVGVSELSIVWEDPETGVLCKARIDRLCEIGGWPFVVDVKTSHKPASTHAWEMSVEKYVTHEQAAHYLRGLSVLSPLEGDAVRKFAWLVCETERPYCVRMFEADDAALSIGNDEVSKHLRIYSECSKAGVWPGWGEGMDVAGLPAWAYKRFGVE
jgi:exodeoxyribonuclease VIII